MKIWSISSSFNIIMDKEISNVLLKVGFDTEMTLDHHHHHHHHPNKLNVSNISAVTDPILMKL